MEAPPPPAEPDKSYVIPAFEIVGFDLLLNLYNRRFSGISDYDVTGASIRRNLRGPWVVDNDPFKINQFAHPYQGSIYHAAGRSTGLNYWQASALTFAGSAMWELAGERTAPSRNDQVASGNAGSFLGEPLFRMARLVADRSSLPESWRYWLAAVVSPPVGFNRMAFGSPFEGAFVDNDPEYYGRLHIGATRATQQNFGTTAGFKRDATQVDFALDYGLPGKPGYTYKRPFDYFNFQLLMSSLNGVENLTTRGLLYGTNTGSATTIAASGACSPTTTTSRRKSSTSRRLRSRSAALGNGGPRRTSRCKGPRLLAWGTRPPARSVAWVLTASTTTVRHPVPRWCCA